MHGISRAFRGHAIGHWKWSVRWASASECGECGYSKQRLMVFIKHLIPSAPQPPTELTFLASADRFLVESLCSPALLADLPTKFRPFRGNHRVSIGSHRTPAKRFCAQRASLWTRTPHSKRDSMSTKTIKIMGKCITMCARTATSVEQIIIVTVATPNYLLFRFRQHGIQIDVSTDCI